MFNTTFLHLVAWQPELYSLYYVMFLVHGTSCLYYQRSSHMRLAFEQDKDWVLYDHSFNLTSVFNVIAAVFFSSYSWLSTPSGRVRKRELWGEHLLNWTSRAESQSIKHRSSVSGSMFHRDGWVLHLLILARRRLWKWLEWSSFPARSQLAIPSHSYRRQVAAHPPACLPLTHPGIRQTQQHSPYQTTVSPLPLKSTLLWTKV